MCYKYPLFFEKTRKIVRIYEILNSSTSHSYVHQTLIMNNIAHKIDYQILDGLIMNK